MAEVRLTETITVTEHEITEDERLLSKKYNMLVDRCLDWAQQQMHYGLPATRLAITRAVIASASRLAALDTKTHQQEQRLAFQALLAEHTSIDTPALDQPANAITTPAATQPTLDQD